MLIPEGGVRRSDGQSFTSASVTSKDGTQIGYRRYGVGPGVILVQGAMGTTHSYHELALHLASDFTVYVPERRGRPLSPCPFSPDHSIDREVEDLAAVFDRSGAAFLFGLSSGAVIALETARRLANVRKLVLYEPPLYVPPRRMRFDLISRYNREVEAGDLPAALVSALMASGLAPTILKVAPRALTETATAIALCLDALRKSGSYPALRELVPTMRYDFNVVGSVQNRLETFASVRSDVVLLNGDRTAAYLREACAALEHVIPTSHRIELKGLAHSGPWNADRGGKPEMVAAAIELFLNA